MDIIEVRTLIDITNTKVNRLTQGSQLQIDQQRNFITLMQCIEIRSIVSYDRPPTVEGDQDLKKLGFGAAYKGRQTVWTFRFATDRDSVYLDDQGNPIGSLLDDVHEVPVIRNLTETINIDKSIFDCKDHLLKNTIIRVVPANE
jgi:hypothetical protein